MTQDDPIEVLKALLEEVKRLAETSYRTSLELAARTRETQDVTLALIHDVRGAALAARIADLYRERWETGRLALEGVEGIHDLERWLASEAPSSST